MAVVTGGSRGIGRAICLALAGEGAQVAVGYTADEDAAREVAAACSRLTAGATAWRLDVSAEEQVEATVSAISRRHGRVDVLVNNAGVAVRTDDVSDVSLEQWNRVLGVNLTGPFLMTRAVAPLMKQRGQGRIVNVASVAGTRIPGRVGADYSASKAGLIGLTRYCSALLAPHGIRVNAVAPAFTDTDMLRSLGFAGVAAARPEDIAETVLWLCTPSAGGLNGECLFPSGR